MKNQHKHDEANRNSRRVGDPLHTELEMIPVSQETLISQETLSAAIELLRSEYMSVKSDYVALSEATHALTNDRDALKLRNAELEAINRRLTDMLWGRRSERRTHSSATPLLNFGDDAQGPLEGSSEQESPEIISAQRAAQEAYDKTKLEQLEARRKARSERRNRTEEFPAHLERRVRILDLPEDEKEGLILLGVKVVERLRFENPKVYVEQIHRPEYVKANAPELGVQSAPSAPAIIEGCKYDFSVIAAIVTMKFAFHNPTYRQEDYFGQSGWRPSRSTSNDLINYAVDCIDPLFAQMWNGLLKQTILVGDDTTLTVLLREAVDEDQQQVLDKRSKDRHKALAAKMRERRSGKSPSNQPDLQTQTNPPGSATSYAWLYSGLDAPAELASTASLIEREHPPPNESPPDFGDRRWEYAPYNIFHWSLTHEHSHIDSHLADFQGIFVGDATGANARLGARSAGRIAHQSCNSHARREFVKAESNDSLLSSQMVSMYRQLYAVEYRGADMTSAERLALRQREAVPIWNRMQAWLSSQEVGQVLPKSSMGQAIGYLRNQWSALRLYLTDGAIPFDNNISERVIRPLTIGRKNWLFLGSAQSAPGRLKLYSIISSAQRHCLSIQAYLEDIFLKLSQAAQHRPQDNAIDSAKLMSLLPDRWAALHPEHVHSDRLLERQLVAENKKYYRLQAGLAGQHPYGAQLIGS